MKLAECDEQACISNKDTHCEKVALVAIIESDWPLPQLESHTVDTQVDTAKEATSADSYSFRCSF